MAPTLVKNPTVIERFIGIIPLPYPISAIIWAVILSPDINTIQHLAMGTAVFSPGQFPTEIAGLLVIFYLFIMVRYMRLKVAAAESQIVPRLTGGNGDYRRAFGRMTLTIPVLFLTAIIGPVLIAYSSSTLPNSSLLAAIDIICIAVWSLAFSTYLWMFGTASLGLHKLGGSSLRLGSFQEDRMMGAKPLGNLALSLTVAYFGGLLLLIVHEYSGSLASNTILQATTVAFLPLGVALFFLPLDRIHAKMQAEKRRLLREIGARYPSLNRDLSQPGGSATIEDVHIKLTKLTELQEVEMLDRKIASLPTWPFDIQVVSKFITIVLSVTGVLLSRVIANFLHI